MGPLALTLLLAALPCAPEPPFPKTCTADCAVTTAEKLPVAQVSWSLGAAPTPDAYYPGDLQVDSRGHVRALMRAVAGHSQLAERGLFGTWSLAALPTDDATRFVRGCDTRVVYDAAGLYLRSGGRWTAQPFAKSDAPERIGQLLSDGARLHAALYDDQASRVRVGSGTPASLSGAPLSDREASSSPSIALSGAKVQVAWADVEPEAKTLELHWSAAGSKPETLAVEGLCAGPILVLVGSRPHLVYTTCSETTLRIEVARRDDANRWSRKVVAEFTDESLVMNNLMLLDAFAAGGELRIVYLHGVPVTRTRYRPEVQLPVADPEPDLPPQPSGIPARPVAHPPTSTNVTSTEIEPVFELAWSEGDGAFGHRTFEQLGPVDQAAVTIDRQGRIHLLLMPTADPGQVLPLRHVVLERR